ncbi:LacI family DNA-binding transcriptional regulator [Brachybacterium sp. FME24]|uniref:LacI family DNA-binding transcriptional regulator n=1 Tax=Brachybacterium sp. FME24 TaxID=2742605 RepID=UPI0018682AFA|nr:LacI family DNA-binding transcriptional regulator [Brachybacterium sp. FME24]
MSQHPSTGRRRPPSLRDVAEIAGVSIKTVSNVVNDYPYVRDTTREKVREAILQVGYRPQVAAQQLRTGASKMVTLAVPSLTFSYFSDLAQEFIDEAQLRGQTVVLHSISGGREAERTVLEGFNRVLGDGVIFNPLQLEEKLFARMERTSQPTVFIGEHLPEALPQGSDYVRIDNVSAAFDQTSHLITTGRRRIAFIGRIDTEQGAQPHSSGSLRRDGYLAALREHGLPADGGDVQAVADWRRPDGFAGAEALFARRPDVDGIVCGNDDLAIGVLATLRRLGRRVPEDVAVIGYDDTPDAPFTSPPLTTISPDKHALAATALDLLAERIQGYDGPPRVVDTPYTLVIRDSTTAADAGPQHSPTTPSAPDLEELPR